MIGTQLLVCCVVFVAVVYTGFCSFPNVEKYEGVFMGEGINCGGTSAKVITSPQTVKVSNEDLASVVGNAIAEGVSEVKSDPTRTTVNIAAQDSSQKILEVVSEAVAEVSAEINSPNPGCWAIGFGRAEAKAIAEATVTAIAQAFAKASEETQVRIDTSSVDTDLQTEIEEVVLLLSDGKGSGIQSKNSQAIASVKAQAMNCALAKAYVSITEEQAIAYALAGCAPGFEPFRILNFTGCECLQENDYNAPNLCGQFGDQENGDFICYTSEQCQCAQQSLSDLTNQGKTPKSSPRLPLYQLKTP